MSPKQAPPVVAEGAVGYTELLANLDVRRWAADHVGLRKMVQVLRPHPAL